MKGNAIHVIVLAPSPVYGQCEMKARTLAPGNERVEVVRRRTRSICERGPGVNVDAN